MRFHQSVDRIIVGLCLLVLGLTGCSGVGPNTISRGRADYNQAIQQTDSEQMLMAIVRNRYGESFSMLAVTSVTANVRIVVNASAEVGVGPSENFAGNLVPLTGGFLYEENPTISYAPVHGEQYLRELLSSIPLDLVVMVTRSVAPSGPAFTLLVSRVNEIRNPAFRAAPSAKPDPRFTRFVELIVELEKFDQTVWVQDVNK